MRVSSVSSGGTPPKEGDDWRVGGCDHHEVVLIPFVVLAFFVPWPWQLIVLGCGLAAEITGVEWGRRLARQSPKTGLEAMMGQRAHVLDSCHPRGRVRVHGEIWNAVCAEGADPGEAVTIVDERELTLEVIPVHRKR